MSRPSEWKNLDEHFHNKINNTHLAKLLSDEERNSKLLIQHSDILMDLSHEKIDIETLKLFAKLVEERKLWEEIDQLFNGVS